MKIIKNEIRPIGFITVEFSENEIQTIIGALEELQMYKNMPYEEILGTRGELYSKLKESLEFKI